jgi:hypothetical protein
MLSKPPSKRLWPRARRLFAVRWISATGQLVRHRYFTRRRDAEAWAARLRGYGKDVQAFETTTRWTEVSS